MKVTILTLATMGLLLSGADRLSAQSGGSYDLTWNTLAGGGGTCAGGTFALSSAIGQPDAGHGTGGSFSVDGGFWPPLPLPPVGPSLRIMRDGFYLKLSWPINAVGLSLYRAADVTSNRWSAVTDTAFEENGEVSVWLWPADHAEFYQLMKP